MEHATPYFALPILAFGEVEGRGHPTCLFSGLDSLGLLSSLHLPHLSSLSVSHFSLPSLPAFICTRTSHTVPFTVPCSPFAHYTQTPSLFLSPLWTFTHTHTHFPLPFYLSPLSLPLFLPPAFFFLTHTLSMDTHTSPHRHALCPFHTYPVTFLLITTTFAHTPQGQWTGDFLSVSLSCILDWAFLLAFPSHFWADFHSHTHCNLGWGFLCVCSPSLCLWAWQADVACHLFCTSFSLCSACPTYHLTTPLLSLHTPLSHSPFSVSLCLSLSPISPTPLSPLTCTLYHVYTFTFLFVCVGFDTFWPYNCFPFPLPSSISYFGEELPMEGVGDRFPPALPGGTSLLSPHLPLTISFGTSSLSTIYEGHIPYTHIYILYLSSHALRGRHCILLFAFTHTNYF